MIIRDFKLKIPQRDILVYGPYQVGDQYFKVDYVVFNENTQGTITVEFDLNFDGDGNCKGVQVNDYVY